MEATAGVEEGEGTAAGDVGEEGGGAAGGRRRTRGAGRFLRAAVWPDGGLGRAPAREVASRGDGGGGKRRRRGARRAEARGPEGPDAGSGPAARAAKWARAAANPEASRGGGGGKRTRPSVDVLSGGAEGTGLGFHLRIISGRMHIYR
nr:PE-PGRS family protein PE_PGRS16-like [Aegilops tauschii subsp. strangulata]